MILAIVCLGTVVAAAAAVMVSPKYTAMVRLLVEPQPAIFVGGRSVSPIDEAVDTHVTLIGSIGHLRRVAESISQDPLLTKLPPGANESEVSATGAIAGRLHGREHDLYASLETLDRKPAADSGGGRWLNEIERRIRLWMSGIRGKDEAFSADLEELARGTKVYQERRSRVISLAFTSDNREKAAAWANRIAELYIDNQVQQQQIYANTELGRLNERIATLKIEMERARLATQQVAGEGHKADEHVRELERHAATSSQQYNALLRRQKELRDKLDLVSPGIWIHSLASLPERPSSHNPILFVLPAMILLAIGGSILAVVLEQLDRGMRGEREVNSALGIPCIGLVPRMPGGYAAKPHRYLVAQPFSAYAEAIRSVFSALYLEQTSRTCQIVLVSSSLRGEGKSTLAVSLAAYAALVGRRVLLVDLDVRHPSIGSALRGDGEKPGADLILTDCGLRKAIQHVPDPGLDYLSITGCPIDPVELLARDEMSTLLQKLRRSYDHILIDGPPVLGATEARLLALLSDAVVFVVKWGSTRCEIAQNALNLLRVQGRPGKRSNKHLVSVIAQVNLKRHAAYRYGDLGETLARLRSKISVDRPGAGVERIDGGVDNGRSGVKA